MTSHKVRGQLAADKESKIHINDNSVVIMSVCAKCFEWSIILNKRIKNKSF